MVDINSIKTITVIGAGTMGHEIAQVALMAGFKKVIITDLTREILNSAVSKIENNLVKLENKNLLSQELNSKLLLKNLFKETDLNKAVSNADFIIEAIPEKMNLKQNLFENLGKFSPNHAILASNTSTMSITKIASKSGRANNVVGMHFFTPIVVLRLIEVIKGENTSEETMNTAINFGLKLPCIRGKRFIARIEKESPGFIVNRLIITSSMYINWLLDYAVEHNIAFESIDADFADLQQMGPCARFDYLGLDVVYNSLKYFEKNLSPDFAPGRVLTEYVNDGKLGKKTGRGFCKWTDDGKLLMKKVDKANLFDFDLYMALQLNEGCRLLEEKVVTNYKTIDDTMLAGMSTPGPFGAGKRNYKKWCYKLEEFVEKSGKKYFLPCDLMSSGEFLKMRK
ncbi:MAG: 3-hydroxyacyl-CoA dehydrogenase family protein [Candidatus Hermodarchaeota archaeon]